MADPRLAATAARLLPVLDRHGEALVDAAVADLDLPRRDVAAEYAVLRWQLSHIDRLSGSIQGRPPWCRAGEEIALLLPYNVTLAALWDLARLVAPGNRVRVRFSSRAGTLTDLVTAVLTQAWPGEVRVERIGRESFLGAALHPDSPVTAVFGYGGEALGAHLLAQRGAKKIVFEGPGKDPVVVLPGADVAAVAQRVCAAKFAYAGQQCVGPEILVAHRSLYQPLVAELTERFSRATVGDPTDPGTDVGPVASDAVAVRLAEHLREARAAGAEVVAGGGIAGRLVAPTLVCGVRPWMRLWQEESFAAVLGVAAFDTVAEAVTLAKSTRFGLGCSVFGTGAASVAGRLRGQPYAHPVPELTYGRYGVVAVDALPFSRLDDNLAAFGGYGVSGWVWDGQVLAQGPKCFAQEATRPVG